MIQAAQFKQLLGVVAMAATLVYSSLATAQTAAPARLRGTVTAIHGDTLDVTLTSGVATTLNVTSDTVYYGVGHAKITDIKSGSLVGSAAVGQSDGSLEALEVQLFGKGMNPREGHFPWDLGANSTMTNGTVGDVMVTSGRSITIQYPSGAKTITIPAEVPIVTLDMGDRSLLLEGAHGIFSMKKLADGSQVVDRASMGKGDVVPPM